MIIILLVALVLLSAFFSSSETAISTSNKLRIKNIADKGNKAAQRALNLIEDYSRSISTILIGNNLVNIAASSASTILFVAYFGASQGPVISSVFTTVVLLIFGETLPKIIAADHSDKWVMIISLPMKLFSVIFKPIVAAVSLFVKKIERFWTPKTIHHTTEDDLLTIVDTIEEEGVFTEREGDLIKSAIEISEVTARDILIPRVDVTAYDINDGIETLINDENFLKHSRIPVYSDSLDNIIGILSTKRLLRHLVGGDEIDITSMMKQPMYVFQSRPISSILTEFKQSNMHMAIVVDEFGGTVGVLTLEDILEEIVGEIYDESDDVEQTDDCIDGSTNLYDVFEDIGYEPDDVFEADSTSVGGWMTEMLDRFPVEGDKYEFDKYTFIVVKAQAMRVEKIKITVKENE